MAYIDTEKVSSFEWLSLGLTIYAYGWIIFHKDDYTLHKRVPYKVPYVNLIACLKSFDPDRNAQKRIPIWVKAVRYTAFTTPGHEMRTFFSREVSSASALLTITIL